MANDTENIVRAGNPLVRLARFYRDGFRAMTVGRTLWIIIIIKLAVIFAVLRLLFFAPAMSGMDAEERAARVRDNLTERYDNLKE